MTFLMNLDPQFNQVRTNLLMNKELPDVSEVYRMLLQEESHKDLSKPQLLVEPMAFITDKWKTHHIGKNNHNSRKPNYFCDHYKIAGYSISRCFKLHGYSNKAKPTSNKSFAALAHHNEDNADAHSPSTPLGLTPEQYTTLISLLDKTEP